MLLKGASPSLLMSENMNAFEVNDQPLLESV